jgi:hypothetical protein
VPGAANQARRIRPEAAHGGVNIELFVSNGIELNVPSCQKLSPNPLNWLEKIE